MSFKSILFEEPTECRLALKAVQPHFFIDLNLDQIIDSITAGWQEYDLKPFFYFKPKDITSIYYRHEVFQDLENPVLNNYVKEFAEKMHEMREYLNLIEKFYYKQQKEIWFLYAAEVYCNAVKNFKNDLISSTLKSKGFIQLKDHLINYTASDTFIELDEKVDKIKADLRKVKYRIIIRDTSFTVQDYEEGIDYSSVIEETFARFRQRAVKDYRVEYKSKSEDMNHIEAKILDYVAELNPEIFSRLENFLVENKNFIDEIIVTYDREVHFYISYLEHIRKFKNKGLQFCYPQIRSTSAEDKKEIYNAEGFDLALAQKIYDNNNNNLVCNDFCLKGNERIIVVTGPNQGGKTTFARTFGQLHYHANLGCPVPGKESQLYFYDQLFAQFERPEKVEDLRGKLEDDLKRVYSILDKATSDSIIIMNEIFNSTALQDMTFLSKNILEKIIKLDLFCVWVTFVDELTLLNKKIISMTSTIVPENPALRTFKIVKRPADGLAYAMAIAEKYKLTYNCIKERISL
jgi:DNA mismatch repair ATPase MutS